MSRPERPVRPARPRRAAVAAVALAAVALGLAGCGPQRAAVGPTSTTDAVTSTPSPSPTPSVVYSAPPEATRLPERPAILDGEPSEKAAIAFAEYYLRMYVYAYLTGDGAPYFALAQPGCTYCNSAKADILREYAAGGRDEGGDITIEHASAHDFKNNGAYKVVLYSTQAPSREIDAQGRTVVEHPESRSYEWDFGLVWNQQQGWRVAQMAAVSR